MRRARAALRALGCDLSKGAAALLLGGFVWIGTPSFSEAQPTTPSLRIDVVTPQATPDVVPDFTPNTAPEQSAQPAPPAFGECEQAVDDEALRTELSDRAQSAMRAAMQGVDYRDLVIQSWRSAEMDAKLERIVDAKLDILRADRAYVERLLDGNIPSRAEEMATRAATMVFESPEFAQAQEDLRHQLAGRLEPMVADADAVAQSYAARCVQAFLGARYAQSVQSAFEDELSNPAPANFEVSGVSTSVALNLSAVIAAMLAVVFRRLVRRIVSAVVRRLAGAIAARAAAWASVLLGALLLVYELIAGADGVFPVIREELLSLDTKLEIQQALVEELENVGPEEFDRRAEVIAELMVARWKQFKQDHRAVLELAEKYPGFRDFLSSVSSEQFDTVTTAVASINRVGGEEAVLAALDNGVLAAAVDIPGFAVHLDEWGARGVSVEELVAWSALAGDRFEEALRHGLPELLRPDEVTQEELSQVLSLGDRRAIRLAAALTGAQRGELLALEPDLARALAAAFPADRIAALFEMLRPLPLDERLPYLRRVAGKTELIDRASARSAAAVANSRAPGQAVSLLLDESPLWSPISAVYAVNAVSSGDVGFGVVAQRYGWALLLVFGLPLLLVFWILRRILRWIMPRRPARNDFYADYFEGGSRDA
ncbi:MAG: hypothetical protein KTR21_10685 [Rhodobacteraceae bacterium]|nr:hypothetical protein [Paracoccaceae bacterium]